MYLYDMKLEARLSVERATNRIREDWEETVEIMGMSVVLVIWSLIEIG